MEETTYAYISPFRYMKSHVAKEEGQAKSSISSREISALIKSKDLSDVHFDILDMFVKYKYMTTYYIEILLNSSHARINGQDMQIKNIVSMMVKNGLIVRHHFEYEDSSLPLPQFGDEYEGGAPIQGRSGCFYRLSRGAADYLKKKQNKKLSPEKLYNVDDSARVMQCLSSNFLVIRNESDMTACAEYETYKELSIGKTNLTVDACCKVLDGEYKDIEYFIFSVRRNMDWDKELCKKVELTAGYFQQLKSNGLPSKLPCILLVCEDDRLCLDINTKLAENNYPFHFFYTTDTRQYNESTNKELLYIEDQNGVAIIKYLLSPLLKKKQLA